MVGTVAETDGEQDRFSPTQAESTLRGPEGTLARLEGSRTEGPGERNVDPSGRGGTAGKRQLFPGPCGRNSVEAWLRRGTTPIAGDCIRATPGAGFAGADCPRGTEDASESRKLCRTALGAVRGKVGAARKGRPAPAGVGATEAPKLARRPNFSEEVFSTMVADSLSKKDPAAIVATSLLWSLRLMPVQRLSFHNIQYLRRLGLLYKNTLTF